MLLVDARVTVYKSIDDSGEVPIDPEVTVLVGKNESGKTAFLEGLFKARPVDKDASFNVISDYPRKGLNEYQRVQAEQPAVVCVLTYSLSDYEIEQINTGLGLELLKELEFTWTFRYGGGSVVSLSLPEDVYVQHLVSNASLPQEHATVCAAVPSIRKLVECLEGLDLNTEGSAFLEGLKAKFNAPDSWSNALSHYVWTCYVLPRVPKFLYFDDYYLLPGKINLPALQQCIQAEEEGRQQLRSEDKTAIGLLRMAGVDIRTLTNPAGYEEVKAKLEAISNSITDRVFEYWTQNPDLDVEFDIRADPQDAAPFSSGQNLYIRIRNRRHRVTVPFSQRSKGFIWFFSFIIWFDSIKQQMGTKDELVLLLDEPGLSLHALGQADFLRYIDHLSEEHQIVYTTHSPFMVHSDRLHQVRVVEDLPKEGTRVRASISGSDPNTVFPLQAALGYTIAQNLFVSKRNLLVEGPADLVYLRYFSAALDEVGRTGLGDDITIVPVGGLDKLATFVALLRGNELQLVVLHDYLNKTDPRLDSLVREKLIREKQVLNYALFRDPSAKAATASAKGSVALLSSDVEDMISPALYLMLFNAVYAKELGEVEVKESALPGGDRIVERIEAYLRAGSIQLRASGGYNHYLVASHLASHPLPVNKVDDGTLARFEYLFGVVNGLLRSS